MEQYRTCFNEVHVNYDRFTNRYFRIGNNNEVNTQRLNNFIDYIKLSIASGGLV